MNPIFRLLSFAIKSGPLKGLSVRVVLLTLLLTFAVVWIVRVIGHFQSSFWLSVLRGAIGAFILLFAYILVGNLRLRWVSQRTLKYLMVPILTPLGLLLGYFVTMPPNDGCFCGGFLDNSVAIAGWARMSIGAVLVASIVVYMAISRERDRDAADLKLKFALERERLERKSVAAQMEAMRARMEPHFLFNTLANIQQLVQSQSPSASNVLSSLIAYLRTAVVEDRNGLATLAQEFDRAKHYLAIMQMRMPDRLQFELTLPDDLGKQVVPTFAVLTLVENAIAHGIDPTENGGWIYVSASAVGDLVQVDVLDTGAGVSVGSAEGFGLRNLRDRLAVIWQSHATLSLQNTTQGSLVRLTVPHMSVEEARNRFAEDGVTNANGGATNHVEQR
jgi:Histidine kinase